LKLPELNIEQSRGLKKPTNAAPRQNTWISQKNLEQIKKNSKQ
jgi:hypothetical protein